MNDIENGMRISAFRRTLWKMDLEWIDAQPQSSYEKIMQSMANNLPNHMDVRPGSVINTLLGVVAREIDKK